MSRYCGSCNHLSITEKRQGNYQPGGNKLPHICNKFGKQVMHCGEHPSLPRLSECLALGKVLVQQPTNSANKYASQIAAVCSYIEQTREDEKDPVSILNHVYGTLRQLLV